MLAIRRSAVYPGPNIWTLSPVILLDVESGALEARLSRETPVFFERLVTLVPALRDCASVVHQPEGGLRRLLLDRLALALQEMAKARADQWRDNLPPAPELTYAQTHPTDTPGLYTVVYASEHREVGLAAGKLAVRLLNHLLVCGEPGFDLTRELETTLVPLVTQHADHPTTGIVVAAAERRGIPVQRLRPHLGSAGDIVQLGNGAYQRRLMSGTITSKTGVLADRIATDKGLTSRLLREAGLPVPRGSVVHSAEEAVAMAASIGYPVVVKPLDASQGRAAAIEVRDEAEVLKALAAARRQSRRGGVVVEAFIRGNDYRILVVDNQVVAVAELVPAHVIGDGTHTVAELIDITNADPHRGVGHERILTRITVDEQTHDVLTNQELTLDDIPDAGRFVDLKQSGNISTGGTAIDRSDEIHPDNAALAWQAAMVVGLDVAGIDVITPDITRSIFAQGGAIIEVNSQPSLRVHLQPTAGQSRDVGMAIIDHLFPAGQPVRVSIVAVTGTNGKTTTTRMITHILTTAGKTVGMTSTDGIFLAGVAIATGDSAGASAARKVLRNPAIDVAVLETARGSILKHGLGFDRCDVAVVTNVAADHLGVSGITTLAEMAQVKAVVPRVVVPEGVSVLNADNPYTVEMAAVAGGEIVFFSLGEDNPVIQDHIRQGGRAAVLRQTDAGEMLVLLNGTEATELLRVPEIPATMEGRIRANIANALAATAAAIAQDVPVETIRAALRTFHNNFVQTPGRFNFLEIDGRIVLVDYCHNPHGLEALADVMKRLDVNKAIGVIRMPGDRRDEDIEAFGRLAAKRFDEVVIREGKLRGRSPGEVPDLLRATILANGLAPDKMRIVLDERQAVESAIAQAGPGDLVVVMVDGGQIGWL